MSDPDRAVLITARIRLEMQIVREELEHDAG